jgi:hypothetical protein
LPQRLLWVLIWLGLAIVAPAAAAADFDGVGGAVLHFNPPAGYCLLPPSSPDYLRLRNGFAPESPQQLKAIFLTCADVRTLPAVPRSAGYVYLIRYSANNAPTDEGRSEWLKKIEPDVKPGQVMGVDSIANAAHFDWVVERDVVGGKVYAVVNAQGATVVQNTPVVISVIKEVEASDIVGVATALDSARKDMHVAFSGFAKDNGLSLDRAVTYQQARETFELASAEFIFIAGAIVLVTIVVQRFFAQATLSALLAVAGVLVYQSSPGAGYMTSNDAGDMATWALMALVLVGITNGALRLGALVGSAGQSLTDRLRNALSTRSWSDTRPADGDFTKRWFVTVAAATGCVVFAMLVRPRFFGELLAAFAPTRIIFTLLITVVSATLIGPIETYIFESPIASRGPGGPAHLEEESRFEHMLELMSFRALGRFALVLAFMLMLTVAHGALEASVHEGDGKDTLTMLVAGVGPAIVTYYWCCGLQRGVTSVGRRAGVAAGLAGLVIVGVPIALVSAVDLINYASPSVARSQVTFAAVAAPPVAMIAGATSFGGLAFGGGLVIDLARRWRLAPTLTVAALGVAMIPMAVVYLAFWTLGRVLLGMTVGAEQWLNGASVLLGLLGWTSGLMVSGFPGVLRASLERAPPPHHSAPTARSLVRGLQRLGRRRPSAPAAAQAPAPEPGSHIDAG